MWGRLTIGVVLAATAAVALPAGAQVPQETPDPGIVDGSLQRELDAAKKTWRQAKVTRYRFRLRTSCFCGESFTRPRWFEVRNGKVVKPRKGTKDLLATVPRLHRVVQDAIDRKAAQLDVRYDKRGVPRSIAIDRSRMIADEEMNHTVDRFERLRRKRR